MTIVFTACLAIMAAPYILQVVSPEFAAELNQIQTQTAKERLGEKLSSHLNLQLNLQVLTNLKVLKETIVNSMHVCIILYSYIQF